MLIRPLGKLPQILQDRVPGLAAPLGVSDQLSDFEARRAEDIHNEPLVPFQRLLPSVVLEEPHFERRNHLLELRKSVVGADLDLFVVELGGGFPAVVLALSLGDVGGLHPPFQGVARDELFGPPGSVQKLLHVELFPDLQALASVVVLDVDVFQEGGRRDGGVVDSAVDVHSH